MVKFHSYSFIIMALATWRISYMFVWETGPWNIFVRFRKSLGIEHDDTGEPFSYPDRMIPQLFSCVDCLSVWVALGIIDSYYFFQTETIWACLPFALSAIAVMIDRYAQVN